MKLLTLDLHNFRPYRGDHRIQFPTDPERPVMIVYGGNMWGKTSLLNALQWVLYGQALDRQAKAMDLRQLLNSEAASDRDWGVGVTLRFEADGSEYELRRWAEAKESVLTPKTSRDFNVRVLMRRDGDALPGDAIQPEIERFIPEEVSRFYLFDGELLQQYEELVRDDTKLGREIQDAIERVLGVPALINGRDDVRLLAKGARKELARQSQHVDKLKAHADQSSRIEAEVQQLSSDLASLRETEARHAARIETLDAQLDGTDEARSAQQRIRDLEASMADAKEAEAAAREERLRALQTAWQDLVQPRLAVHRRRAAQEFGRARGHIESLGATRQAIADVEAALEDGGACTVCRQPLPDDRRDALYGTLGDLRAKLNGLETATDDIATLGARLEALNAVTATGGLAAAARAESALRKTVFRQQQIAGQVETYRDQLRDHDMRFIQSIQRERDGTQQLLGQTKGEIQKAEAKLETKQSKLVELGKLMAGNTGERHNRAAREVATYDALDEVLTASIDRLRDALREKVEAEASEAFRALTTEPGYTGLEINDRYGLTILDEEGMPVPERSAGAEHIVALALLSALNQTAERAGPVIIDTPFGRLDSRHRENILRYVPTMADQVVFFVHDGEVNLDTDLDVIGDRVSAVYEIERHSTKRSSITLRPSA